MLIGVISDSHDNIPIITKAVQYFNDRGVKMVIHAGDYVAPFALKPMAKLNCEYVGVFGNNDGEILGLNKVSEGRIKIAPYSLTLDNKKILVLHEPGALEALTESQVYDIIIYGHTHEAAVKKHGKTLVVNPGECGGWLEDKRSIAIINLDDLNSEIRYL
ncbi:YfcE family phosphodiesterase [Candidatus Poribacteria bacterium]|nr:YfcE family phosphodiesterase [Candidatus Poribacteria bacterium]